MPDHPKPAGKKSRAAKKITDLRSLGPDTEVEVVQAVDEKEREWLLDQPVCIVPIG